ncbi:MAG: hypothetical protein JST58_08380 [Bacteroidetes bacterium]|nr:hypothetical protein [Bacteroidota bacterium]
MKKIIFFAAVMAFNYANAQIGSNTNVMNSKTEKNTEYNSPANNESSNEEVGSKVMKHFSNRYPNAINAQWSVHNNKTAVCRFYENDILHRVYYNTNGRWSGTVTTYQHFLLPENIKIMVSAMFPEYVIKLVKEVNKPNHHPVYVLHAQSLKYLKILRATDEEGIEVIQNFESSN